MLSGERAARAVLRWLDLLSRNSISAARTFLRHDARYTDLTTSEYDAALEWLLLAGLVTSRGLLSPTLVGLAPTSLGAAIFDAALTQSQPDWLPDADITIQRLDDVPYGTAQFAEALGLSDDLTMGLIGRAQHKIDLEARGRLGRAGECALIAALESRWPGSTVHVADTDDTAGFDIAFRTPGHVWHLEVKTTGRRGRLQIYLSRNEHDTSLLDPLWVLVAVGLDQQNELAAVATVPARTLQDRCPRDIHALARWTSARYILQATDLRFGIVLGESEAIKLPLTDVGDFSWMPPPGDSKV